MANELFCLKWNNYTSNIITELDSLRTDGDLVDVTILCDGRKITAHKVILSACSSYFRTIFRENPCQHPVVILKDINYEDIEAVLCFVYQGTVYISKSRMDSFLKTAESLQIKGLAGASNMMGDNEENRNISSEETSKIVKRTKPVPPLASVSTNVPAATSSIPRNSPINNNTPLNKRRKLFPNSNQVEDSLEDDSHHMSTIKIQNEDSRSLDSSANRQDRHSSSVGGIDKDSIDQDDESNTYNNTAYSSTGEVEDDNQMQYTDDNEDDDDDEGETSDSISQTNSISTQSSGQAVQKPPRGSSRERPLSAGRVAPVGEWRCMQPQICHMCSRKFSNAGNLRQHITNVHAPAQQVPCDICARVFKNKEYLRKHYVQIHGAPLRKKNARSGSKSSGNSSSGGSPNPTVTSDRGTSLYQAVL
uniref:Broad-complex core protein isoform 6 n=1 Tax=Cacopsylla melanoneura TaxID=428564 RepID=A0A8D9DMU4_9HEMI